MYRTAAKRLFLGVSSGSCSKAPVRFPNLRCLTKSVNSESFANQSSNQHQNPLAPDYSDSTSSSTSSNSSTAEEARHHQRPRVEYQEEQARVLGASVPHVLKLGWTEAAMIAGARDAGVSPAIIGSFPRREAALVEFFMDECLQRLIDRIDSGEDLKSLIPSERISKLIRFRLETQAPFISKWPQALSIQAQPANVPTSFKQRAVLIDEICHAAGDEASDIDWYVKRTVIGGIYSTTEIYMLTDNSPDFRDTWAFLGGRVKDAFDLKKSVQEAKYLAEAVGAGIGSSVQGFVKRAFQG
ncbi:uncharacterized protein LOC107423926 [Ziziphus jujuba]|uniref:Ubiquinone biosynthesis protein n=1 Tax=Ziziphus jujuba TaxID=326968 RepID=A0A6P4AK75_ZIZJJ|nr:uncharacterized protein LOC107423926 [Ziziphus jujuba]